MHGTKQLGLHQSSVKTEIWALLGQQVENRNHDDALKPKLSTVTLTEL